MLGEPHNPSNVIAPTPTGSHPDGLPIFIALKIHCLILLLIPVN